MKATEFCYWLQGYFELAQVAQCLSPITAEQAQCIRAHLKLVREADANHDNLFVAWLSMRFGPGADRVDADGVAEIKRYLARQFRHEIDPSYGGDQKKMQEIHDSWRPPPLGPGGTLYRC